MKNYFIAIFALFMAIGVMAQPQAFKYQTVVRDSEGEIVANQNVSFQMKIRQGSAAGSEVYTETHTAATNQFGLANLVIGQGTVVSGEFATIGWGADDYFLEISFDINGGTNYLLAGTSQLMAVPYALYAKESGGNSAWQYNGNNIYYSSGNVGIGTTQPGSLLDVHGGTRFTVRLDNNSRSKVGNLYSSDDTLALVSFGNVEVSIDEDNNSTNKAFRVVHNKNSELFRVQDNGRVGIGTNNPEKMLDVTGETRLGANTTLGSGNWIGLYFNGYGNDDQPEWLFASHDEGGFQFRRWDGVDFSEHYLKVNEGLFNFGAYDCPPLKYYFNGWTHISDSLKVGNNNLFVGSNGKVGLGTNHPAYNMDVVGDINYSGTLFQNGSPLNMTGLWSTNTNGIHFNSGSVGIGVDDPGFHKLYVAADEPVEEGRAIAHVRNTSSSTSSICNLYISAGTSGSTYLNYIAPSYIHWGGRYKSHSMLGNNGKGLVFRTGENNQGRFAFEFRSDFGGSYYTYDEKVSITYDGNVGIGTINPAYKLDIMENSRFSVDVSDLDILKFGNLFSSNNTLRMASYGNVEISLDDNNTSTDNSFRIVKDNGSAELFRINDTGEAFINGVMVGNGGNGITATVLGYNALASDQIVSTSYLTAIGSLALNANTTGIRNTATGSGALQNTTDGSDNTANGVWALYNNTNGIRNTAMGYDAMFEHTTGGGNTSIGCFAGRYRSNTNNGTFVGYDAYASTNNLSNVTGLGYDARPTASNQVKIGNSSVTSIGGSVNWTIISDERFKVNLKDDVKGLDFILKLRPVTFNYAVNEIASFLSEDSYTDESGNTSAKTDPLDKMSRDAKEMIRYTGFLAQEVEEVAKQVGYDFSGVDKPTNKESLYGIRYAEFVAPLVKAIQEQQEIIENLKARIEVLENR